MEGTITRQLEAVNFEVETGEGLVRRHAEQLVKPPPRWAKEEILDVQVDNTANNPGTPAIPEEIMKLEGIHMEDAAAAQVMTGRPTTPIRTSGLICSPPIKLNDYICSPK